MTVVLMTSEAKARRRRRLTVRIYPTKLQGGALSSGATIRVDTKFGFRSKQSLLSLKRENRRASSHGVVRENGGAVEWTTNHGVLEKGCSDQSEFDLSFSVLRKVEGREEMSEKWEEIGRLSKVTVEELGNRKEMSMEIERKIRLQGLGGSVLISTLTVLVSIAVDEGSGELNGVDSTSLRSAGFFKRLSFSNTNKVVGMSSDSGQLRRSNSLPIVEARTSTKSLKMLKKMLSFFAGNKRKVEGVVKKIDCQHESGKINCDGINENVTWEMKEIVSRDGEAELKCSVGLASFDQCSKEVAGEGACSVIVALVAHWLHMNKGRVPSRAELDRLMVEGAAEWKKLGTNEAYRSGFPDKHFDIETVVRAGIRSLSINQENSVVGFFSPDKFNLLKGAVCFDGIWSDIVRKAGVYIVSWNDHFCVLKVEDDACYLIDSLGRRLEEGCNEAFILKFDESSVMKHRTRTMPEGEAGRSAKDTSSMPEPEEAEAGVLTTNEEEEEDKIICRGRDCCKEFFKRFLAAILVKQLEEKVEKDIVGSSELYRMLQIEFQYTTSIDL